MTRRVFSTISSSLICFPNLNPKHDCAKKEGLEQSYTVCCERFFGLSGYMSQLSTTQDYAQWMLSQMLWYLYVDPNWVAQEYLRQIKAKTWKLQQDEESLKCFNLEGIFHSEAFGVLPCEAISPRGVRRLICLFI